MKSKIFQLFYRVLPVSHVFRLISTGEITVFSYAQVSFPRLLTSGSGALRGDGGVYVDTVQCTGSGTLPTEPALWRMGMGLAESHGHFMEIHGFTMISLWISIVFYGLLLDCCWIPMFFGTFSKCAENALKIPDKNTCCFKEWQV